MSVCRICSCLRCMSLFFFFFFFFFQAEDGIRDATVTGVQTCALPISMLALLLGLGSIAQAQGDPMLVNGAGATFPYPIYSKWRSEERRVGKECRSRWSPDH